MTTQDILAAGEAKHPLAGQTVKIRSDVARIGGQDFKVEDWFHRVLGKSWMDADGNFVAMEYAIRSGTSGLPIDNSVLYGKIGLFAVAVHVSELDGAK